LRRDRRHVDRDERPVGAPAQAMDRPREELLAGSWLAHDEDRQRRARRLLEVAEGGQERGVTRDDADALTRLAQPLLRGIAGRKRRSGGRLPRGPREPGARLCLLGAGPRELGAQAFLGAGRAGDRRARRLEIFLEALDLGLLAHQRLTNRADLVLETADPI